MRGGGEVGGLRGGRVWWFGESWAVLPTPPRPSPQGGGGRTCAVKAEQSAGGAAGGFVVVGVGGDGAEAGDCFGLAVGGEEVGAGADHREDGRDEVLHVGSRVPLGERGDGEAVVVAEVGEGLVAVGPVGEEFEVFGRECAHTYSRRAQVCARGEGSSPRRTQRAQRGKGWERQGESGVLGGVKKSWRNSLGFRIWCWVVRTKVEIGGCVREVGWDGGPRRCRATTIPLWG